MYQYTGSNKYVSWVMIDLLRMKLTIFFLSIHTRKKYNVYEKKCAYKYMYISVRCDTINFILRKKVYEKGRAAKRRIRADG